MIIELGPLVGIALALPLGAWALRQGWLILRKGEKLLPPTARAAIWLLRATRGEEAASQRYEELTEPDQLRQSGYSAIIVGACLFIAGVLSLIGIVLEYSEYL
jgi:hypothetical protein